MRCLGGCGRLIPTTARKSRCASCVAGLDAHRKSITPSIRRLVFERDGGVCQIGRPGCTVRATEVDHVDPSGPSEMWNFQAACKPCNSGKRDRA